MQHEKRGSEKLRHGCSGLTTLSGEELARIGGGFAFSPVSLNPTRVFRVFPDGIIDPEVLRIDRFGQLGREISNGI
jgi:hypothetical protein